MWSLVKSFVPKHYRWFYEGHPDVPGQMWYAERKALYETILRYHPDVVCESGTWLGGGSTLFISQALFDNKKGVLHTTEADAERAASATQNYERHLSHLRPFVQFHCGSSVEAFPAILAQSRKIDAVLLDGAEDAEATFSEFRMFEPSLSPNAIVMAHDWNTAKAALIRPFLEKSSEWKQVLYVPPPHSVGFAVFQRVH